MNDRSAIVADPLRAADSFYGPCRDDRPSDLGGERVVCPFCPGNEALTGPALVPAGPDWTQRVVRNRFPAIPPAAGRHEVIVETRAHDVDWPDLPAAEIAQILRVYRARERAGYDDGYAYVTVFKNAGRAAGATLTHPHAQVVALWALPLSIRARLERLPEACAGCEPPADLAERIVDERGGFYAAIPAASRFTYELRIAPRAHLSRFAEADDAALEAVAALLGGALKRLRATLGERLPFNLVVQSAPRTAAAERVLHWEIEVIPRTENFAGFELGTGSFFVNRLPADAAATLRAVGAATRA
jgi:UDPglucose--hexose-1-phosphate uridylyltransferase